MAALEQRGEDDRQDERRRVQPARRDVLRLEDGHQVQQRPGRVLVERAEPEEDEDHAHAP